ncbi:MAG: hypothetical protein ACLFNT_10365 [Spirochaetales bacterium]
MQRRCQKGVIALAVLVVVAGCATGPPSLVRYPEMELPDGYSAYFSADVSGNRELFGELLEALEVRSDAIVNRTERLTGGFDLAPSGSSEMAAIAYGSFPRGLTQFSLRRNRAFDEASTADSDLSVFVQVVEAPDQFPLHVLVPQDDVVYLAAGLEAEQTMVRLDTGPASGRQELRRSTYSRLIDVGGADGPIATVVFEDPGSGLLRTLGVNAPGVPITEISLSLYHSGDELMLHGELGTRTAGEAALFSRLSRFFVLLFVRSLGLDAERAQDEVEISVEGAIVRFSNIPLSSEELSAVVLRFGGGAE